MFDQEQLRDALEALVDRIAANGESATIEIVGGSALAVLSSSRGRRSPPATPRRLRSRATGHCGHGAPTSTDGSGAASATGRRPRRNKPTEGAPSVGQQSRPVAATRWVSRPTTDSTRGAATRTDKSGMATPIRGPRRRFFDSSPVNVSTIRARRPRVRSGRVRSGAQSMSDGGH